MSEASSVTQWWWKENKDGHMCRHKVVHSSEGDFLIAIIYAISICLQFILFYSCLLIHLNNACTLPYLQSKWRVGMWCLKHPVNSLRDDKSSTQALEPLHMLIKFLWLTQLWMTFKTLLNRERPASDKKKSLYVQYFFLAFLCRWWTTHGSDFLSSSSIQSHIEGRVSTAVVQSHFGVVIYFSILLFSFCNMLLALANQLAILLSAPPNLMGKFFRRLITGF